MTNAFSTNRAHFDAGYAGVEQAQKAAGEILHLFTEAMAEVSKGWGSSAGVIFHRGLDEWTVQHDDITARMARIGVLLQTTQGKSAKTNEVNVEGASQIVAALRQSAPAHN